MNNIYNYKIINKAYPQITINDVNNHLKEEFEEINIYTENNYLANVYTLALSYGTAILGYTNQERIVFVPSTTNTGNVEINVLGLGNKKLFLSDGISQVPASYLTPNTRYYCEYGNTLDGGVGAYKISTKTDDENLSEYVFDLINTAYFLAEKYTNKTFTITTFEIEFFETNLSCFELRKCPFIELIEVYINDAIYDLNEIDVDNTRYPFAILDFNSCININSIKFKAGYEFLPYIVKNAILNIVGYLYENRGDCMNEVPNQIMCDLDKEKLYKI
ncbi:MAG: hypothetical protein BV456_01030 [Thermoplasmata archaeon M8B2D]|nr:MAG: hypothetical protein BV456_01030 [Thermoplasmata archaeon M8B2D]